MIISKLMKKAENERVNVSVDDEIIALFLKLSIREIAIIVLIITIMIVIIVIVKNDENNTKAY